MNKKGLVIGLVTGLSVGLAGAAFAYFSSTGSGSGSASIGSSSNLTIAQDANGGTGQFAAVTLYPGAGSQGVGFTITNPGGGHEEVQTVTASVAQDTTGTQCTAPNNPVGCNANYGDAQASPGGADIPGCLASWFTLTNPAQAVNQDIAGSGGTYDWNSTHSTLSVSMSDANAVQDACHAQTILLSFSSN